MSAINPIPVVKNNIEAYRAEVLKQIAQTIEKRAKLDAELRTLDELARVVGITTPTQPENPDAVVDCL